MNSFLGLSAALQEPQPLRTYQDILEAEFGIILAGKEGRGKEIGREFPSGQNPFTQASAAQSTSSPGVTLEVALLDAWGLLSTHLSH